MIPRSALIVATGIIAAQLIPSYLEAKEVWKEKPEDRGGLILWYSGVAAIVLIATCSVRKG